LKTRGSIPGKVGTAFLAACLLVLIQGCERQGPINERIVKAIKTHCANQPNCTLRISDQTPFSWDKMFVFDSEVGEADRTKILGTKDVGFCEFEAQLVFTKNGQILYQESQIQDVENPSRDQVKFGDPDWAEILTFSPDAVFAVSAESSPAGPWYFLRKLN
jgi:hypothetical protein